VKEEEINNFIRNSIWKEIVAQVAGRAFFLSEENDVLDPGTEATKLARNQGQIIMANWIVDLPAILVEEARSEAKGKNAPERGEEEDM
jgi:hypothetical protein